MNKKTRGITIVSLIGIALVSCAAFFIAVKFARRESDIGGLVDVDERPGMIGDNAATGKSSPRAEGSSKAGRKSKKKRRDSETRVPFDDLARFNPTERRLVEAVNNALDNDDLEATLAAARKALLSENPEVRQEALDALGWFGKDAISEITPLMADPDEDVAESARDAWENALNDIDSAQERLRLAKLAIDIISDEDSLTTIGGIFSNAASDFIDDVEDEDEASRNREEIVLAVEDLILNGKAVNSDAAKEIYEDITGNEWISEEETRLYLSDPDEYETPEERMTSEAERTAAQTSRTSRSHCNGRRSHDTTVSEDAADAAEDFEGEGEENGQDFRGFDDWGESAAEVSEQGESNDDEGWNEENGFDEDPADQDTLPGQENDFVGDKQ